MIDVKELRVGNMVIGKYYGDEDELIDDYCKVIAIDETYEMLGYKCMLEGNANQEIYREVHPIQLKEEILLKCEGIFNEHFYEDIKILSLEINGIYFQSDSSNMFKTLEAHSKTRMPVIKTLHQLQNLYFALTSGTELIVHI